MKLIMSALFGSFLVAALLVPPWRMAWIADGDAPASLARPVTWAGFHRWSFAGERPTSVTAWDGPNGGGKVTFTGHPQPVIGPWAVLVACAGLGLFFTSRRKRQGNERASRLG